ncbi:MAG: ABC transporter ATP-binding protein [Candidatus Methylumidiphilus sp.]
MNGFALHCNDISVRFGGVQAVRNVSLHLTPGRVTALVGPNGAGKTTLLNALAGFISPDSGTCTLGSIDITRLHVFQRARLGLVKTFQHPRLATQLSTRDHILSALSSPEEEQISACFRPHINREDERRSGLVFEVLESTGLASQAEIPAGLLSFGQKKLLQLACALAMKPRVLLLDEPIAGVEQRLRTNFVAILAQVASAGMQVLFVEHDLGFVRQCADRVVFMDEGAILFDGNPAAVLSLPDVLHAYVG